MADENTPSDDMLPAEILTSEPELTGRQKLWLVGLVIMKRVRFIAILAGVGLFIAQWDTVKSHWDRWTHPRAAAGRELPPGQEFFCSMDPQVVRTTYEPNGDVPNCPICGMPLSIRAKGQKEELPAGITGRVRLSPERVQMAGIKTVAVDYRPDGPADEDRGLRDLRREPAVAGRQPRGRLRGEALRRQDLRHGPQGRPAGRNLQPRTVQHGPGVDPGQPQCGDRRDWRPTRGRSSCCWASARRKSTRIAGLRESRRSGLVIRSPQSGYVVEKKIVAGASVEAKMTLFEVADLSTRLDRGRGL